MKKGYGWLRYGVQVLLILAAAAALILCRQLMFWQNDSSAVFSYMVCALAVVFCLGAVTVVVNLLFDRRGLRQLRRERDTDLLALKKKAQTDSLTGLLNREAAIDQITHFLKTEGCLHSHSLLIVDLDNFKSVNDSFGHFEGDKVLKTLSAKIRDVFRGVDIVGRLGGDEFIILMKHTATKSIIRRKALELQSALEYITTGGDVTVTVTGSIGISIYSGNGKSFETLYKEADEALYQAKLSGKNRHCYYKESAAEVLAEEEASRGNQALNESSASIQLQALIDNIDGGIALLEIADEIRAIFLSHSYVKLMHLSYIGIKRADNRVFSLIHRDDISQVEELVRQGAVSGKPVEAVFRRLADDGKIKWYHMRAVRIQYEDSDKPVLIAIVTDVTNLKETERNYQAQKKQLETVLRISHVVTFEVDIERRALIVADPTVIKYGIDTHVIENMPDALIDSGAIHPDSVDECRRMYSEIYAGIPEGSAIIRTLKRDGQYTIERFTYFTVFDDNGRPVKAVGVDEGLETHSQVMMRVDLLERQFRYNSDNMILVVKVTLRSNTYELLKADPIAEEIAKKTNTSAEFLELGLSNVDEKVRDKLRQTYSIDGLKKSFDEGRALISDEYFATDPSGNVFWHTITAALYVNQMDGDIFAFIRIRDITRRVQLENELQVKPELDPKTKLCYPESLVRLTNALILKGDKKLPCAIVLLSMDNYETLLRLYGSIMMEDLLVGFNGKVRMVVYGEHFTCYDGKGTMTILVPDVYSGGWLRQLLEKTFILLKNPAFFQIPEEQFIEYRCGVAISDGSEIEFDDLTARALEALRASDSSNYIRFYNHLQER